MSEPFIEARGVGREYSLGATKVRALDGADVQIDQGEFVVLLGVSGSGKSTLLHLLGALDQPTSGEVRIAGKVLNNITPAQRVEFRRRTVGFVFQSFHLVSSMTAADNVALALTLQSIYGHERKKKTAEALKQVGLAERSHHRPRELSGGEQQRVAIARAIAHRPAILLADEPTGNLDHANGNDVLGLFKKFQREHGCTVVMATHDEELGKQYADRIIRLRDGKVAH